MLTAIRRDNRDVRHCIERERGGGSFFPCLTSESLMDEVLILMIGRGVNNPFIQGKSVIWRAIKVEHFLDFPPVSN